jgi:hypothetical protein
MSNYQGYAINPVNGLEEKVMFLDDYFGPHEYGVRFSDGKVYEIHKVKVSEDDNDD